MNKEGDIDFKFWSLIILGGIATTLLIYAGIQSSTEAQQACDKLGYETYYSKGPFDYCMRTNEEGEIENLQIACYGIPGNYKCGKLIEVEE